MLVKVLGYDWDFDERLVDGPRGPVRLSNRETSLLRVLHEAGGAAVTRDRLADRTGMHTARRVDFAIRRLRRKLEQDISAPRLLLTVRGYGYRLGLPTKPQPAPPRGHELLLGKRKIDLDLGIVSAFGMDHSLTTLQLGVLRQLVLAGGSPVTRETLLSTVWGEASRRGSRPVDATIQRLRTILEVTPSAPVHVLTVRSVGYRLQVHPPRTNVSEHNEPMVGRDADLEALTNPDSPRWTLIEGPPGIGKSRLAHEAIVRIVDRHRGGAWWVDCQGLTTAEQVVAAVCEVLGLSGVSDRPTGTLTSALQQRGEVALVLDNLEQISDAEQAIGGLLKVESVALAIGTSTRRLDVPGGRVLALRGLNPTAGRHLYRQVARRHGGDIASDEDLDPMISEMDGFPFAIVLAARRPEVSPRQVVEDLSALGSTQPAHRHDSLQETVAWSWRLLGDREREVLSACTAFLSPFSLEAAMAVADVDATVIHALHERCMLALVPGSSVSYRLFAPIRAFARKQSRVATRDTHAAWFSRRARWLEGRWRTRHHDEAERESIRCAADFYAAARWLAPGKPADATAIVHCLAPANWLDDAPLQEVCDTLLSQDAPFEGKASLFVCRAMWQIRHGQRAAAEGSLQRARQAGVPTSDCEYREVSRWAATDWGTPSVEDLPPCTEHPDHLVDWLEVQGIAWIRGGERDRAIPLLRRAELLARRAGDQIGMTNAQSALAQALDLPVPERAERFERLMEIYERRGGLRAAGAHGWPAARLWTLVGRLAHARGLALRAEQHGTNCDVGSVRARAGLVIVGLDLAQANPLEIVERSQELSALGVFVEDRFARDIGRIYEIIAHARLDRRERAHRLAETHLPEAHPQAVPVLSALAQLYDPHRTQPLALESGSNWIWFAHATSLVSALSGGAPMPEESRKTASRDPVLQAIAASFHP